MAVVLQNQQKSKNRSDVYLLEDLEDFIDFRIAREQGFPGTHLSKDTAYRPHIDTSRVLATSE